MLPGGVQDSKYVLIDTTGGRNRMLEEMEVSRILFEVYEGGVVSRGTCIRARLLTHGTSSFCIKATPISFVFAR